MNLVNSEHKRDSVNLAFPLQKKTVNKRPKNLRKERVNGESEWWPLSYIKILTLRVTQ